jgi:hypothetical protein
VSMQMIQELGRREDARSAGGSRRKTGFAEQVVLDLQRRNPTVGAWIWSFARTQAIRRPEEIRGCLAPAEPRSPAAVAERGRSVRSL